MTPGGGEKQASAERPPPSTQASHRVEALPLSQLAKMFDPGNPKSHDLPGIKASLRRHGYVEPSVIDERTGYFGAGHGRIEALVEMHDDGEAPPRRVQPMAGGDWLVPVLREAHESADDIDAEHYIVASNGLTAAGGWDDKRLTTVLADLKAHDALEGTGFTAPDLDALLASFGPKEDPSPAPDQSAKLITRRSVLVDVADDKAQRDLIDRLDKEGFRCRALNS